MHEDREKSANACFCLLMILQNKELHGLQENVRHVYIIKTDVCNISDVKIVSSALV